MNFDFTDDQHQIKRTANEFLAARYKPETIRELAESDLAFTDEGWSQMAELGWHGLAIPEEHGGQGLGVVELAVIMEELGYALAPTPFLSNTIFGLALAAAGTEEQKQEFLRPATTGERRGTVALYDAGGRGAPGDITMEARRNGDGIVLDGEKLFVWDAAAADWLLVGTADGGRHLVDRDAAGVTVTETPSIDRTRRQYAVRLEGVAVSAGRSLEASPERLLPVRDRIFIALAAELVGVAQRTMEMAVSYAKERQQFGRAIGSYQAVSHRCAQMLLETEGARSVTYYAAWAADHEPETAPLGAAMAKAYASDAGFRVAASALQVHGGIGFTWEHDLHLWLKRARADAALFGDARWHRERVAQLTGLAAGAGVPGSEPAGVPA